MGIRYAPVFPEPVSISDKLGEIDSMLTCLGDSNQILVHEHGGDRVHLDSGRRSIQTQRNVLFHDGMQASVIPLKLLSRKGQGHEKARNGL